ncbi:putative pre-mRNA-splicing factor ATP-dependent RNA helicase DHX16 [Platysternon megacephalum]|uniref:Putative pre-mRNA-splicing factor ATP-dependent RNA helicase DHX16 n=1 Tax=Platysternon megacephalum TaxID=55544 RepID=A0A4D9DPN4_9SAUR|nr:putative pre-mRNA-splicing factor ATP-dependent RNA helicase DHX16 [Platysternon megacephalum]
MLWDLQSLAVHDEEIKTNQTHFELPLSHPSIPSLAPSLEQGLCCPSLNISPPLPAILPAQISSWFSLPRPAPDSVPRLAVGTRPRGKGGEGRWEPQLGFWSSGGRPLSVSLSRTRSMPKPPRCLLQSQLGKSPVHSSEG